LLLLLVANLQEFRPQRAVPETIPSAMPSPQAPNRPTLRIAVLSSTYPPNEGDHQVPWLRESVNRIAGRGHSVIVIAPAYRGSHHHTIDGVRVRRFRYGPAALEILTHGEGAPAKVARNPLLKLLTLTYLLSGVWSTWRLCARERIEVLHVHWPFPHGLMVLLPKWLNGVRIISTCHSAEITMAGKNKLSLAVLSGCLRTADVNMANSSHTARLVREISGKQAHIVPYGATVKIEPASGSAAEPFLLFSGRLIPRKGVCYLLEAMPWILERHPIKLVITGDGPLREALTTQAKNLGLGRWVEFAGFVTNDRLGELFRTCALYVHPAICDDRGDTEGLGVVLIEALFNRKPVIASDVGGIVDVIKHGETGLLVPEKDPQALAAAVDRILNDHAEAARLGARGYDHASRFFAWERITDDIERLYFAAVKHSPARQEPMRRWRSIRSLNSIL
jgi:glycosyltransferase involved in cell wall biosynthesis